MKKTILRAFPVIAVIAGVAFTVNKTVSKRADHQEHDIAVSVRQSQGHKHSSSCGDNELRLDALDAVLNMDEERAMPLLLEVLERHGDCDVELRKKAVFLVSQQETGETVPVLEGVVRNDPSLEVQEQAVFWLSQVDGAEAVTALESVLFQSPRAELQEKAIFALSQHGSAQAQQILRMYVRSDAAESLRENAIFWLGQEGSSEDQQFLAELYGDLHSKALKEKVIFAVSQRDNEASRRWLLEVADNDSELVELRKNAVFWLSQQGGYDADQFAALYRDAREVEIKEQVLFALSQLDDPDAVADLIAIARAETNADLRKNAMFWLGQSSDPRAVQFLAEVIGR